LTKLALRNRSIVALTVVAVVLLGIYAVTSLKEELIPDMQFPYLTVFTVDVGASPSDVERDVTTPIEQALKTTGGIKEYDSYSNEGTSIIIVQYEFGTDMKAKEAEVQQAVSSVSATLPQTAQDPKVAALNFNTFPVIQLAVSSSLPGDQLATLLQTTVVPRLQAIDGVQAVTLSGVEQQQLQIQLRPRDLMKSGVSPQQVTTAISQANLTTGAGTITSGTIVYPVTVKSSAATVAALQRLVVSGPASPTTAAGASGASAGGAASGAASSPGPTVRLGDIASVVIAPATESAITRTNGEPTVGVSVSKSASGNTVDIARAVSDETDALNSDLKGKAEITTVVDQSIYITESLTSTWREGLIGAVFAVLVIWLFLRSWRSTLIAGVSIPLSVIGALIILWSRGNSLNMLTLGGLTIAIGRVIDDSIVVIENAYRHLQEGDDAYSAAYAATREVAGAITASTLTTVAVFLPLGMVHGLASEFFRPFALTVTFALLASLLCALTVVPVAVTWVLSKRQVGHRMPGETTRLQRTYLPVLRLALGHKFLTIVIAAAIFVGSMLLVWPGQYLKTNLFDNSAQNTMGITQQMPVGTSLQTTSEAARKVEDILKSTDGIDIYQVTIGTTGSLFGAGGGINASSSQAVFSITTDPDKDKIAIMEDVRAQVDALADAGTITVSGEDQSMGSDSSQIQVRVTADDPAVLKEANGRVLRAVQAVDGLADVNSNLSEGRPSLLVTVDQDKAATAGVSGATLGQYTALLLNGYPLGTVPTESGPLPAQLSVQGVSLFLGADPKNLAKLPVQGTSGLVPLGTIARVEQVMAPVQVSHIDGKRTATITAAVANNNIGQASSNVQKALDKVEMPAGATYSLGGASEMMGDVFRTLGIAMLIAIMVVYIIMVATFRSLLNPLILLVSIPFAAVGAVLLLLITGTSLGMPSLIGLLMLIGIVVTNAIVLLDLVEQFRRGGMDARTAVIEGGRRRLRPILMTAVATILALMPMALGLGKGGFLSAPLAVVVIGGLFTSTLLTLIIVPVLYVAFDGLRPGTRRRRHLAATESDAPASDRDDADASEA
jgi:HAE1 family hydrophobic/amphiphilic exporter-1